MHDNVFWKAFLIFVLACTLIYSGIAIYRYYEYILLTAKQPITQPITWEILEKSDEEFAIVSKYHFNVGERSFSGEMVWSDHIYLNKWAAERAIEEYKNKQIFVWYDQSNPYHSSLQKHFPVKQCIYAIFLWGLFLYFIWLGTYVTKH